MRERRITSTESIRTFYFLSPDRIGLAQTSIQLCELILIRKKIQIIPTQGVNPTPALKYMVPNWKPWKNERAFPIREKTGNLTQNNKKILGSFICIL